MRVRVIVGNSYYEQQGHSAHGESLINGSSLSGNNGSIAGDGGASSLTGAGRGSALRLMLAPMAAGTLKEERFFVIEVEPFTDLAEHCINYLVFDGLLVRRVSVFVGPSPPVCDAFFNGA